MAPEVAVTLNPYVRSGRVGPAMVLTLPLALGLACAFGGLYALADVYLPIVGVFTVMLLLAAPGLLGVILHVAAQAANSRNRGVNVLLGLFGGAALLYASWGFFLYFLFNRMDEIEGLSLVMAFNPLFQVFAAWQISETGWFEMKGSTPSGVLLLGVWAVEALVLGLVPAAVLASSNLDPFCEACGDWVPHSPLLVVGPNHATELSALVRTWDPAGLASLELPTPTDRTLYSLEGATCPTCKQFATFRVQRAALSTDKEGKLRVTMHDHVAPHVVPADQLELLTALVAARSAAAEPASAEGSG